MKQGAIFTTCCPFSIQKGVMPSFVDWDYNCIFNYRLTPGEECTHHMLPQAPRQQPQHNDSDSEWSELENPGQSYMDKLIQSRNRFNLHYHKADITTIPRDHRLPLLPNEEVHDWLHLRKLLSINATVRKPKNPKVQDACMPVYVDDFVDQKDPLIQQLYKEWEGLTAEEKSTASKEESLAVLNSMGSDFEEEEQGWQIAVKLEEGRTLNALGRKRKEVGVPGRQRDIESLKLEDENMYQVLSRVPQSEQGMQEEDESDDQATDWVPPHYY